MKHTNTIQSGANPWDKVAENYFEEIISPLTHFKQNPLLDRLSRIKDKEQKSVGDLGCGVGTLLFELKKFRSIHALDYSDQMLKTAFTNVERRDPEMLAKINWAKESLTQLQKWRGKLDVAISVNSLLFTDPKQLSKAMEQMASCLTRHGELLGIFPALESIQEEYRHSYFKALKKYQSDDMAQAHVKKIMALRRVNFGLGSYDTDDMTQKYFTKFELECLLEQAGLANYEFGQVVYRRQHSYNLHDPSLTGHPYMWDWYVRAQKAARP